MKFKPNNLNEILEFLDKNVPEADKKTFIKNDPAAFHFSAGMVMRNDWGFWDEKSKINKWFRSVGIFHADDMSGIVLESFKKKLLKLPINLEEQVKYYQEYWNETPGTAEYKENKKVMK